MKKFSILILMMFLFTTLGCKKDKKEEVKETETKTETTNNSTTSTSKPVVDDGEIKKMIIDLNSKSGSNVTGKVVFKQEKGVENVNIFTACSAFACSTNRTKSTIWFMVGGV